MLKKIIGLTGSGFFFALGATLALFVGIVLIVVIAEVADDPIETAFPHAKTKDGVFVLQIEGEILSSERFRRILNRAVQRPEIKAIVVAIDSPGGAVGPSEEISRVISAANKKKPVLCALGSVAASGGLYAAVGCRQIYVNRGTLTGSIGVIMAFPTVTQILSKVGIEMNVVKSGELKDVGSPFRSPTEKDKEYLNTLIHKSYEQFVQAVADGRKLEIEKVRSFADGRIILGEEAISLGLADAVGGVEDAAKQAFREAGGTGEPEILYAKRPRGFSNVFDMQESRIGRVLRALFKAELLYRAELM